MTDTDLTIAVDVGGSSIKAELVDPAGTVVASVRRATPGPGDAVAAIGHIGEALIAQAGGRPVRSGGVVVPGIVDAAAGVATYSANIGWLDLPIVEPLGQRWGVPVSLANDVAAAAVAETLRGAGRGEGHVAFVVIGTGVAAAFVSGGFLLQGHRGETAELGHVIVRPGTICGCGGDGCLEAIASARAIAATYTRLSGRSVNGAHEVVALIDTDEVARRVWSDAVDALADALTTVSLLLSPAVLVVGGGLGLAGARLTGPLRLALEDRARVVSAPRVVTAELGDRGGVVGAALLAQGAWAALA